MIELDNEGPWPCGEVQWSAVAERAYAAVVRQAAELSNQRLSTSVLLTSDIEVQSLNRQWRGKEKPTNVLSFPMLTRAELFSLAPEGPPELLGDIALAYETCVREAEEKGVSLQDHTAHLIIHGLLHLAGYDHETSVADAAAMEALEIKALALMGIGNPYDESTSV